MSVVGLKGPVHPETGADHDIVALAREILAEAERGEIIGLAAVTVLRNMEIGTRVRNAGASRHLMVAATVYLQHDLTKE